MLDELARLGAAVVGETRASAGTDALRATLRQLFTFELVTSEWPMGRCAFYNETAALPHTDWRLTT